MINILVVEDNEMNMRLLVKFLQRKGFHVIQAINGQEGVDMAINKIPDLILMDISLPVMNGYDAIKMIKSYDATKNIPIIALTANAMQEDYDKAINAGCDDYIIKPFVMTLLLGRINSMVNNQFNPQNSI